MSEQDAQREQHRQRVLAMRRDELKGIVERTEGQQDFSDEDRAYLQGIGLGGALSLSLDEIRIGIDDLDKQVGGLVLDESTDADTDSETETESETDADIDIDEPGEEIDQAPGQDAGTDSDWSGYEAK